MAKQFVDIGTVANDHTGDTLRDAFDKTNDNFTELYTWTLKWVGNVAIGGGSLSVLTGATGSGSGGALKKADVLYNTVSSTSLLAPDGASVIPAGSWIVVLQDSPTLISHFSIVTSLL
jgi:hypothetical protein